MSPIALNILVTYAFARLLLCAMNCYLFFHKCIYAIRTISLYWIIPYSVWSDRRNLSSPTPPTSSCTGVGRSHTTRRDVAIWFRDLGQWGQIISVVGVVYLHFHWGITRVRLLDGARLGVDGARWWVADPDRIDLADGNEGGHYDNIIQLLTCTIQSMQLYFVFIDVCTMNYLSSSLPY